MAIQALGPLRLDPFLGALPKVQHTSNTLLRVVKLHDALSPMPAMRRRAMTEVQKILTTAADQGSVENAKSRLAEQLQQMTVGLKEKKNIAEIYKRQIDAVTTEGELKKCIRKISKDLASIQITPLQKSHKGLNGPTLIASYSRTSKKHGNVAQIRNYVIKWTSWNEMCASRLYEVFTCTIAKEAFTLPKAGMIDLERKIHEDSSGALTKLSETVAESLSQTFLGILQTSAPGITPKEGQLMIMEKVNGSNLIDFAKTKYPTLKPAQKHDLFNKLGRLAATDLIIGNTDRLLSCFYDTQTGQYQFQDAAANLDNVMIEWLEGTPVPKLYAIDNSVDGSLIANGKEREAYRQFCSEQLGDPTKSDSLATWMLGSMLKGLIDEAELCAEKKLKTQAAALKEFECLQKDLENPEIAKKALCEGLIAMSSMLKGTFPFIWNSEESKSIKEHLQTNHPELLNAISERFQIFNQGV